MNLKILTPLSLLVLLSINGCSLKSPQAQAKGKTHSAGPEAQLPQTKTGRSAQFYKMKVTQDPENYFAQNALAGYYLKLVRETGDHGFLSLAEKAAKASLQALPARGNPGGLAALAQVYAGSHQFKQAKVLALELVELAPHKSYPLEILGDVSLELGDYEAAQIAYEKAKSFGANASIETRLGRLSWLKGQPIAAERHFTRALAFAQDGKLDPQVIAWCHWQLGDSAFSRHSYQLARVHYKNSLKEQPDYIQSLASLGRLDAAEGKLSSAIALYEKVINIDPMPVFVAALGDLYLMNGQKDMAERSYKSVIDGERNEVDSRLDNRQLISVYADHDVKASEAYQSAVAEFIDRKDIYGADAVAWTALKAGKLKEADEAMTLALKLKTRDAKLYYHAGMIDKASGKDRKAIANLRFALEINPNFDPFQAQIARNTLSELLSKKVGVTKN
ncbi:MAG TPA: hypothetical protein VNJ01_14060 [Bacteriovoracaceae bacterium]|nr:hypothetical protein [Bacteriovoracaceae bacterium]